MSFKGLSNDPEKLDPIAKMAFKELDQDGNGFIDFNELSLNLEDYSEDEVKKLIKILDTDKSGKISFQEFKNNLEEVLEQIAK